MFECCARAHICMYVLAFDIAALIIIDENPIIFAPLRSSHLVIFFFFKFYRIVTQFTQSNEMFITWCKKSSWRRRRWWKIQHNNKTLFHIAYLFHWQIDTFFDFFRVLLGSCKLQTATNVWMHRHRSVLLHESYFLVINLQKSIIYSSMYPDESKQTFIWIHAQTDDVEKKLKSKFRSQKIKCKKWKKIVW